MQKNSSNKKRVLKNSAFNSLAWIFQVLFHIAIIPLIINNIGMEEFGLYSISLIFVGYFSLTVGLNHAVIKYISEYYEKDDLKSVEAIINNSLLINLFISIIGMLLIVIFSKNCALNIFKIPEKLYFDAIIIFKITGFGFVSTTLNLFYLSIFKALQRYDVIGITIFFMSIVHFLIDFVIIMLLGNIELLVLALVGVQSLSCMIYHMRLKRIIQGVHIYPKYEKKYFTNILHFSTFSFTASLAARLCFNLDRLFIGIILGTQAVGGYFTAQAPLQKMNNLGNKVLEIFFPYTSQMLALNNMKSIKRVYIKVSKYILFISISIFIPIIICSYEILSFWINEEVARNISLITSILATSFFINFQGILPSTVNLGVGRPKINWTFSVINLFITAIIIYPMLIRWGLIGAAITTFIRSLHIPILIYVTLKNVICIPIKSYLKNVLFIPILIGIFQSFFLYIVTKNDALSFLMLILVIIISVIINFLMGLILNMFDSDDKRLVVRMFSKRLNL